MPHRILLLFISCFIASAAFAQKGQNTQTGVVFENKTRVVLENIHVENPNNGKMVLTDKTGKFSIQAKIGDLLLFKGSFYKTDTVLVTDLRPREVFLTPSQTTLQQVNVTSAEIKVRPGAFQDPQFHGQAMVYQRDEKYPDSYKGGVTLRLHYWNKDEKKAKEREEFIKNQETQDQITKLFTPDNIAKYIPLKGTDLDNFILLYKPSVKTYTDAGFNLANYLNTCLKQYQELPPDKRSAGKLIN